MAEESEGSELARLNTELDALARYADAQEQKVSQLEGALESRVVIEQAVGMLAERFGLNVADAFGVLRRRRAPQPPRSQSARRRGVAGRSNARRVLAARARA